MELARRGQPVRVFFMSEFGDRFGDEIARHQIEFGDEVSWINADGTPAPSLLINVVVSEERTEPRYNETNHYFARVRYFRLVIDQTNEQYSGVEKSNMNTNCKISYNGTQYDIETIGFDDSLHVAEITAMRADVAMIGPGDRYRGDIQ